MARKRFSDEDILNLLRQIELALSSGSDVQSACRAVGISDATYYSWRKALWRHGEVSAARVQGPGEGERPVEADCRGA